MRKVMMLLRNAGISLILLLSIQAVSAQSGTVTGTVKDAGGHLLPGVSVTVEGKRVGTNTNEQGKYMLRLAPGNYTIVISYVGLTAQRQPVTVTDGQLTEQNFTTTGVVDLSEVVIVGSRSRDVRSKLSTPVPVDVIKVKDIKSFAQADVSQMLTYTVPSFQSARQTIADGTDHIDPAGLRGLGPDQTLVLLNGKRYHNTALVNINGTVGRGSVGVDLNTIPAAAIDRIEVLRDGAAAQYGSDAIAGVINIVLKKNYNGLTVSGMVGQNFTNMPYKGGVNINDGVNQHLDFDYGFAKNNTYLNIGGQWLKRFGTNRSGEDNFPLIYLGNAGAFPTSPYPAGAVSTADYRKWLMDEDAAIVQQRGYNRHNIINGNSFSENFSGFLNAGTKVSNSVDFYLTAGGSVRNGEATGQYRNPNSVAQQPVLADGKRFYPDGFLPMIAPAITDWSLITGFNIKAGQWNLDVSNTIGQSSLHYHIKNSGNASLPATDNVQTTFDAGKLSFLQNTANIDLSRKYLLPAGNSLNVAFGAEYRSEKFQITAGELNSYTNGQRLAKVDSIKPYPGQTTGTGFPNAVVPASGAQVFPGFKDVDAVKATRNIYALYTDLELNLCKLTLDGALRYENYSEKGFSYDNVSGKLSARYELTPGWSVRGSVSNGFRAPSLHQRYFQNTSTQFVLGLPSNSLTANNYNPIVRNAFGIKELKPERSTSYTLGFVGKTRSGITITVDGYFISIKDRIVLSTPFNRSNALVNKILTDNSVDPSTSALQFWTNAVNTETIGIDAVITDKFRLGNGTAGISLAANFNKNTVVGGLHTNSVIEDPKNNPSTTDPTANPANDLAFTLFDRQQRGRIETAQPKSKINLTLTYTLKHWDFLVRSVRFGEIESLNSVDPKLVNKNTGAFFNDFAFGIDQVFNAKITTDVVVTYKFNHGITWSAGANNVFDVYPDRIYIDPRNDLATVYANPVQGANKTDGGYSAGRDLSNRGRFLFNPNQFGFNGRFLFTRLTVEISK